MRMKAAVVLAAVLASARALAITAGSVPASDDTRFDAVGAFAVSWRLGFDQGSHADDADHAWFCSATLVNAQQIQTNRHCLESYGPAATYMVRFRRQTDGSLGTIAGGVSSFYHARVISWDWIGTGNDDIAIGTLDNPVYHIIAIPLGILSPVWPATARPIVQAGWGRTGPGVGQGPATQLLTCDNTTTGTLFSGAWIKYASPDVPEYGDNPCGVNSWDSGGPALTADACGNMTLVAGHISPVVGSRIVQDIVDVAPPDVFYRCAS